MTVLVVVSGRGSGDNGGSSDLAVLEAVVGVVVTEVAVVMVEVVKRWCWCSCW